MSLLLFVVVVVVVVVGHAYLTLYFFAISPSPISSSPSHEGANLGVMMGWTNRERLFKVLAMNNSVSLRESEVVSW